MFFLQALVDNGCNVIVTLIGDDTLGIIIHGIFCFFDDALYIGSRFHVLSDLVVTLEQFDRIESFLLFRDVTA